MILYFKDKMEFFEYFIQPAFILICGSHLKLPPKAYSVSLDFERELQRTVSDLANISNRLFCTVWTFQIVQHPWPLTVPFIVSELSWAIFYELFWSKNFTNGRKRSWHVDWISMQRLGTVLTLNGQECLEPGRSNALERKVENVHGSKWKET